MRVLKLKFSQEIINNGEKCGWLKQMRAADEKHVSNKWWPNMQPLDVSHAWFTHNIAIAIAIRIAI